MKHERARILDGNDSISEEWQRCFGWIEGELGGKIVRAERQLRWRPAWFLDRERGSETLPLYFRGDRAEADQGVYALEHEMIHGLLYVNGISDWSDHTHPAFACAQLGETEM